MNLVCESFPGKYGKYKVNIEHNESTDITKFYLIQNCNEILIIIILHEIQHMQIYSFIFLF